MTEENHPCLQKRKQTSHSFGMSNHAFALRLVTPVIDHGSQTSLHLVVRLYDLTTLAPKRRATITKSTSGDLKAATDVTSFDHCEYPAAAKQERETSVDEAVAVAHISGVRRWVS